VAPEVRRSAARREFTRSWAVEEVVAEDEDRRVVADELRADVEGLGQALGPRLLGIGEAQAELLAVAEEPAESGRSCGVEMIRMSRTPASMSTDSG